MSDGMPELSVLVRVRKDGGRRTRCSVKARARAETAGQGQADAPALGCRLGFFCLFSLSDSGSIAMHGHE
jgi:hypothetical protein